MTIRPATKADCPALEAIWTPMIRDTLVTFNSVTRSVADLEAMIAEKAASGYAFLVAEAAPGQVAGFATYGQFRGGVGYAHTMEHTIILAPQAHGKGLGRALMAGVEDHARARGAHSMFAGVSSGNPAGVAFHARLGYAEVARLSQVGRKFDQWLDLVLMQKFL
ncbi:GNAT family N-acetyltransferase [Pseudoruegeria sp. SHC-113]|uniref:GNAT family N-acetyltransferase n=1 Tax=Pseudoruegeria sp. SHC-113 TaxID=2855439 RepID=UPI0021BB5B44|nr:GNAT family N-acetyltransferase [Pseudoruegeria sp. SHC-113]MCT8161500.1 GNAT family N-acetyltransferase [Pseudoruegeria sp. SHC-113]